MEKINYYIIGRFENGSKYGIVSKKMVEGYLVDDLAAVRKINGRQGDYWITDAYKTGFAIQSVGCKTRKAAIQEYQNNFEQKARAYLTEERLQKFEEELHNAPAEEELAAY